MALWLILAVTCWPFVGRAEVAPGFEPTVELLPPDGAPGSARSNQGGVSFPETGLHPGGPGSTAPTPGGPSPDTAGTGLFGGGESWVTPEAESGGFRGWLADRLLGLGKGLAAAPGSGGG